MSRAEMFQAAKIMAGRSGGMSTNMQRRARWVSRNTSIEAGNLGIGNFPWRENLHEWLNCGKENLVTPDGKAERTYMLAFVSLDKQRQIRGVRVLTVPLEHHDLSADQCRELMDRLSMDMNGCPIGEPADQMECPDCALMETILATSTNSIFPEIPDAHTEKMKRLFTMLVGALYPTQDYVIGLVNYFYEDEADGHVGFYGSCGSCEAHLTESGEIVVGEPGTDEEGVIK